MITIRYEQDPGHGWIVVNKSDIPEEVAKKVSNYSYEKDGVAYLEEDCDAGLYLEFLDSQKIEYIVQDIHTNNQHPCRFMKSFRC